VTRPLEGAHHSQIPRVTGERDQPPAHPSGRARDDQLDHGPDRRLSGSEDAGLDERLAELLPIRRRHRAHG
jgi:hypothetical protein